MNAYSARIKRRNKQGFAGIGTPSNFVPNTPGDYKDIIFNHKHEIGFNETSDVIPVLTKHEHMVNKAKVRGMRHPGSKTLKQLSH